MTYKELHEFLTENGIRNEMTDVNLARGSKKITYWNEVKQRNETVQFMNENGKLTSDKIDEVEKNTGLQIDEKDKAATLENFKREKTEHFDRLREKRIADRLHKIYEGEKDKPMNLAQKIIAQRRQMAERNAAGWER